MLSVIDRRVTTLRQLRPRAAVTFVDCGSGNGRRGSRLAGIRRRLPRFALAGFRFHLHHCPQTGQHYNESTTFPPPTPTNQPPPLDKLTACDIDATSCFVDWPT